MAENSFICLEVLQQFLKKRNVEDLINKANIDKYEALVAWNGAVSMIKLNEKDVWARECKLERIVDELTQKQSLSKVHGCASVDTSLKQTAEALPDSRLLLRDLIALFIVHNSKNKVNEVSEDMLRSLKVPEAGTAAENADGQKQHQQAVAYGLHTTVDGDNGLPDGSALKGLGRFRQQGPHFAQLVIPCGKCVFQIIYDPVIIQLHITYLSKGRPEDPLKSKSSGLFVLDCTDGGQDLLGKGNQQATEQAKKTLCTLAGVVGLDAHAHLHNTPAQDDNTQSLDDGENEIREVVDDGERVRTGSKGRSCTGKRNGSDKSCHPIPLLHFLLTLRQIRRFLVFLDHVVCPPFQ